MGNSSPGGGYNAFDYLAGYDYNSGSQVFNSALIVGSVLRPPVITTLSWAKAYAFDVGIDFSIKQGILSGEMDIFRREMTGLGATRSDLLDP